MAVKTDAELTSEANIIKTATVPNSNTANRIGQMVIDLIDSKINNSGSPGSGIVQTIVPGDNVSVDDTDPANPIVSVSSGGSSLIDWNMSTNAFPTGGNRGQEYYGTEVSTRTTLTDIAGNLLPRIVIAKALVNNPTTNAHFAFINVIF